MHRIFGIKTFAGQTFATAEDAIRAFVAAGCPNSIGSDAFVYADSTSVPTIPLFPRLPDAFAGMTREQMRTAYAAGLRQTTYADYWTAWLAIQ